MFVLFLLLSCIRTLHGVPVSPSTTPAIEYTTLALRDTAGCLHSRTGWDISWSCIITIFACTWSAVHPNIPGPRDSGWTCFKRRVVTMFYAMVAPELMAFWAMRQYSGARKIMRDYNEHIAKATPPTLSTFESMRQGVREWFKGPLVVKQGPEAERPWTITHGFFVQMGGFLLCKGGRPIRTVNYKDLEKLIKTGAIEIPMINELDIQDRSKGDFISKGIVVLQTTWFIIQCATRWAEKLPLTELEVVTLAFAVLNGIIYGVWWYKPQNVGVAVCIEEKKVGTEGDADAVGSETEAMIPKVGWLRRQLKQGFEDVGAGDSLICWLPYLWVVMPLRLVESVLRPLDKMTSNDKMPYGALRVPMFYAEMFDNGRVRRVVVTASLAIAILFGSMHLIAWSFAFPSRTEQLLWRISTLVIIAEPALFALAVLLDNFDVDKLAWLGLPAALGLPLYIIARIFLVTEAFLSLRALPQAAYQSIKWTSVIPHL
ncbi:hypothetical protein BDZ97DRAFT_1915272 [Flammula alnicola]|nr:hypothetical protein BDZ97DRAFT_1915272 [Flammula alnicola]